MGSLLRTIERVSSLSGHMTAWLLAPLVAATVYDVAARYLFTAPTTWAYEIGYMMMGTHALLGMAYTLRQGGHVRIDAFAQSFSQATRALVDLIGYLVFLLPCLLWITWSLWGYWVSSLVSSERSGQSAWNPVIWPFKLVFFVAFLLLVLQIVAEVIKAIQYLAGRRPSYGDADRDEKA
jgi:TRAP-type mannitol/chloroaromatic compound transport system permease small subunit